jgi:hypothetical protein
MKHTFKLTESEMRMIRLALDREALRGKEAGSQKADEYKQLADYFERRIRDSHDMKGE